jgi:transcriptional regulator with XRE-family HTH domain
MASVWFVNPEGLVRARLHQLLKQEDLAQKANVSVRGIRSYERKEQRVQLDTLTFLAEALKVSVKDIAVLRPSSSPSAPPAAAAKPPEAPFSPLPPRTPLETLVDLERDAGIEPSSVKTAHGPAETLTAKRLQDVLTAYALHDGDRFVLTGKVDGMRGIAPDEARLLGSRGGVAARFHFVKEVVPGKPVGVTVHCAERAHTKLLQALYGKLATVVVRVVLVPGEPRDDGPGFTSFITRIAFKRPWTFVVEEASAYEEPAPSAKARTKASAKKPSETKRPKTT